VRQDSFVGESDLGFPLEKFHNRTANSVNGEQLIQHGKTMIGKKFTNLGIAIGR